MKKIEITLFELASRFIGMEEVPGIVDNPQIMAMLQLDDKWPQHDEVPWCFDDSVEILTESGFVPISKISYDTRVAQVNAKSLTISFTYPTNIISHTFNGEVAHINNRDFNFKCDARHKFYGIWNKGNYHYPNELRPISDLTSKLAIPTVKTSVISDNPAFDDISLQLLAAYISDGFNKGYYWNIQVSKERKIRMLNTLNPTHQYTDKQCYGKSTVPLTTFSFLPPIMFKNIWVEYKLPSTNFLLSLSQRQIEVFLDSFGIFDGHVELNSYQLYTSSEYLRDWLQFAITLAGFHSTYRISSISRYSNKPCYEVVFTKNKKYRIIDPKNVKYTKETVDLYCVSVPEGLIIIRNKKGTVIVAGNCSGFLNYVCWLLKLPRSKSLAAISWETIGQEIKLEEAEVGFDIIVYEHHVGIYGGRNNGRIALLGGNQDNKVSIANFPEESVVTVRRLYA